MTNNRNVLVASRLRNVQVVKPPVKSTAAPTTILCVQATTAATKLAVNTTPFRIANGVARLAETSVSDIAPDRNGVNSTSIKG